MNGTRFSEVIESIRSPRMSWALPASREETQDNINRAMLLISIAVASWTLNYLGTADAICFLISSDVVGLPVYALAEAFVIAMFNDETPISIDTDYMNQNCQTISCSTQGDETQYTDPSNTVADNDSSALADYVEVLQTTRAWVLGPLRLEPVRANRNYAFTDEDRDILNIFKSGLRVYTHSFYHRTGRQFPEITQSLVSIQMWLKPTAKTYICISGFSNPQDIEAFDKVLSKKGYKDACRPLEFCYELSHITLSASSGVYDVKSSSTGTLCGSIAIFVQSNGPQIKSTIGGLIEVDSQSFALTTKHRPETEMVTDSEEDSPSLADLMLKLLEDRGVEELTPQKSPPASVDSSNKGAMTPLVDEVDTWEDWDLIPIEKARRLPNFVPNNKSSENTTRSRPVTKFVDFDTNSFYNALPWPVLIISGMSGVLDGLLSSNPSYMHCGIDSSHEVWTVKLKQHDLQAGDSGSWVVRKSDHGLLGMVVARSAGTAYMVSFDKIRESIERSRSLAPHSVELPKFSTKRSLSQRRAQLMSDINEGLSQYHEATPPDNAMTQNNPVGLRLSSLVSPLGSALQTLQNLMSTVIGPMKDVLKPYMENPPARIPRSGGESEPLFNIANLPNSFPSLLQALDTRTILDVCRCVHPLQYVSFAVAVLFISLRLSVGPATIPVGFFYWFPLYNCVLLYLAGALIFVRNPIGRTSEESHGDYHIRLRRINAFRKHFLMWMAIYWGRCDFYAVGICLISGDELDEDLSWHMFCRARDASSPQTPTKSTVKEASRSIWKLISSDFRGFRGMFEVSYTAIAWFLYTKIFRRPNPMPSDEDEPRGPQASERARNIPYDDDGPSRSR